MVGEGFRGQLAGVRRERLDLRPIFVGALDEAIRDFCVARGVPTMLLKGNSVLNDRKKAFITAGDASFKKMGTVKTKFVQDLLEIGVAPISTDADVTWLRDPRAYFETGSYAVADALVSTDCIDVPADKADDNGCSHVNFNTGVLHFRPTEASKAFVAGVEDESRDVHHRVDARPAGVQPSDARGRGRALAHPGAAVQGRVEKGHAGAQDGVLRRQRDVAAGCPAQLALRLRPHLLRAAAPRAPPRGRRAFQRAHDVPVRRHRRVRVRKARAHAPGGAMARGRRGVVRELFS